MGNRPAWVEGAVTDSFEVRYPDGTTHNSRAPLLALDANGTATVRWLNQSTSPCTGSTGWLACVPQGGITTFVVYLRDLSSHPSWGWQEAQGNCNGIATCFMMKRSLIHELGHAIFSFAHSAQGENDTVMRATQPSANAAGWNRTHFRRCDQASAQLTYGARNVAGPIGDCMDHVAGAGANGLNTSLTLQASDTVACIGHSVTLSGILRIATSPNYGWLSGDPLGSRVVSVRRDGASWVTRTTNATTAAYSAQASRSTAGSHVFVASFADEGTAALTGTTSAQVTVTWSSTC